MTGGLPVVSTGRRLQAPKLLDPPSGVDCRIF